MFFSKNFNAIKHSPVWLETVSKVYQKLLLKLHLHVECNKTVSKQFAIMSVIKFCEPVWRQFAGDEGL